MNEIMPFKSFWLKSLKTALTQAHGITLWVGTITIILAIVSWRNPNWEDWVKVISWALPLTAFLITLIMGLMKTPYILFKEKAASVLKYENQEIELVVEQTDQFIRKRGNSYICRIGVKVLGQRTVNNVRVTLWAWNGNINSFGDEPLNPVEAQTMGISPYFSVNPEETKFVEVLSCNLNNNTMGIIYHKNYQYYLQELAEARQLGMMFDTISNPFQLPSSIPFGKHKITIQATGNDTRSIWRDFIVDVENGKVTFNVP